MTDREIGDLWQNLNVFLAYRNGSILVNFIRQLIIQIANERAKRGERSVDRIMKDDFGIEVGA